MTAFAVGIRGLLEHARRAAQRRNQPMSTAHVLLVMLHSDFETSDLLAARDINENALLSALKVVDDERASAIEIVSESAQKLAGRFGATSARPIHLLLAILRDQRTAGYACLERIGVSPLRICDEIVSRLDPEGRALTAQRDRKPARGSSIPPALATPTRDGGTRGLRAGTSAWAAAGGTSLDALQALPQPPRVPTRLTEPKRPARPHAGTPHRGKTHVALADALHESVEKGASSALETPSTRNTAADGAKAPAKAEAAQAAEAPASPFELDRQRFPTLVSVGRNLSLLAAEGRIDPVIGRDAEIEKLLDVLARRRANNPLLVGPPGVGKTAIVEGLAHRLVHGGRGVAGLEGKIVVEVSAGSLVSGTGVRGALAEKLQRLRAEVARSAGRVLLFVDEIHALVSGNEGPDDLASELKAALARGELPCIGATTEAEYRRAFEKDPAFARRFSRVEVSEPSVDDATAILEGLAPRYEEHHRVHVERAAVRAAVELSARYLVDRQLPDKAIGVLDLAGARVSRRGGTLVDVASVAEVIAEQAHVPVERLTMRDGERLLALEAHLKARVVGQQENLARIADALRRSAAGFRGRRPLGTFLLLGPTGVGKTETAKAIAELLFPAGGMTRFDMSEFSEAHAVARLLGAPPGYLGHDHGGQLTEAVRRRPYQLVLFDEIEKAHVDVLLALLPLFDEGRLTDGRGRTVDFTNTVLVLTSNLGADVEGNARGPIGFGTTGEESADTKGEAKRGERMRDRALSAARRALAPELWNRIDEPLFFGPLAREDVREIAARLLDGIAKTMRKEHGVELVVDESVLETLVTHGFDPSLGARPMRRAVGRLVEAPLAAWLLRGEARRGHAVSLRMDAAGQLSISSASQADAAE